MRKILAVAAYIAIHAGAFWLAYEADKSEPQRVYVHNNVTQIEPLSIRVVPVFVFTQTEIQP